MVFLKKLNLNFVRFNNEDGVIFLLNTPFYIKKLSNLSRISFVLWKSPNDHFLWKLRTNIAKVVDLSYEFFKKYGEVHV